MPTIDDVVPDKATYRPNEAAQVSVMLTNDAAVPVCGRLALVVSRLDRVVARQEQRVEIAPNGTAAHTFTLTPPPLPLRGYGLDATLYSPDGQVLAAGSGALDVLERWSQAPRYGFLSDFAPRQEQADVQARAGSLARHHLNVVQFYDWMWRHYRLLPPTPAEEFTDALGRRLSLRTVRAAIEAVQARGSAAMAYGAVYGAEPEFALHHPELMLYDEEGKPISLAELFYIMNIGADSPWVPTIVGEFASAVRALGFDGIHLDQYGFPQRAVTAAGEVAHLERQFPDLINAAREAVAAARSGAGVIFNAVGNWPIETVASTNQDAVYIEVWPPHESYNDLRRLIREGKRLSGGKQVILAAYLSPFADATEETLPGAEAAATLATATIAASGGSHLLLGELDGILCDPYYPKYATMRPEFARTMRAYYDFLVRYEELLIAPGMEECGRGQGADEPGYALEGVSWSSEAEAGKVWAIAARWPGHLVVHLINLTDQTDVAWNSLRTPPTLINDVEIALSSPPDQPISRALVMTPDAPSGKPKPAPWTRLGRGGGRASVRIPQLRTWTTLLCILEERSCSGENYG